MERFQNQTFRTLTGVLTVLVIAACYWQCVMIPQQNASDLADEIATEEAKHQAYLDSLRIDALKHKHIIVHDVNPKTDTIRIALDGRDVIDRYAWNPIEGERMRHSSDSISYRWAKISGDGGTLIDMSVGKCGDFPKWIAAKLSFVFGIDISRDNIENRLDDREEIIKTRIVKYIEETKPLSNYFRSKHPNDYHIVDGDQDIEKIQDDILKIVKNEDFQP